MMHSYLSIFVFPIPTDPGEGSRKGRSRVARQEDAQLREEEELQIRHCRRLLRRSLLRQVNHFTIIQSLALVAPHSCNRNRTSNLASIWIK